MTDDVFLGPITDKKPVTISIVEENGGFYIAASNVRIGPYNTRQAAETKLNNIQWSWAE